MGGALSSTRLITTISEYQEKPRDHCGVVGVALIRRNAPDLIVRRLGKLQHRGQDSVGISTLTNSGIQTEIVEGKVKSLSNQLNPEIDQKRPPSQQEKLQLAKARALKDRLSGYFGIGHVRYATAGTTELKDSQPFVLQSANMKIAVAYNGNIANAAEARTALWDEFGYRCKSEGDTEIMVAFIALYLHERRDIGYALTQMHGRLDGAYSGVVLTSDGDVGGFRDPLGIRPLCMGQNDDGEIMFASESVALWPNFMRGFRDIRPGEMVMASISNFTRRDEIAESEPYHEITSRQLVKPKHKPAHCMFEWVYFADPASTIDGVPVEEARYQLGVELGRTYRREFQEVDIIVPIPDSARPIAQGVAVTVRKPLREGLLKDRTYHGRTFLMEDEKEREKAIWQKFQPVPALLEGKSIALVDDSIVRGNTLSQLVLMVRKAGAKRVYAASGCPPINFICTNGVDMKHPRELAATDRAHEELEIELGVDKVLYQSFDGLKRALRKTRGLCAGCITGIYPTPKGQELADLARTAPTGRRLADAAPVPA